MAVRDIKLWTYLSKNIYLTFLEVKLLGKGPIEMFA